MRVVDLMLKDNKNAREMECDGTYFRVDRRGKAPLSCQDEFTKIAQQYAKNCTHGEIPVPRQSPEELLRKT